MRALIIAGGKTEGLTPFSQTRPKSLIPIAGLSLIESMIKSLSLIGADDIYVVIRYAEDEFVPIFGELADRYRVPIHHILQEHEGIGGAISSAEEKLSDSDEPFILMHGDILAIHQNYEHLRLIYDEYHNQEGATEQVFYAAVAHPEYEGNYGKVFIRSKDNAFYISALEETSVEPALSGDYVFAGCYIFNRSIFGKLRQHKYDMSALQASLIQQQLLRACVWEYTWIDITLPWHILKANQFILTSFTEGRVDASATIEEGVTLQGAVHIGANTTIKSGCLIKGPCIIQDDCFIGNNCLIRDNTVIGQGCSIGYGTEVKNSVLFGQNVVGRLSFVGDSVFGTSANFGSGCMTLNYNAGGGAIRFSYGGKEIPFIPEKLGSFLGDGVLIGSNISLGPAHISPAGEALADNHYPQEGRNKQDQAE